MKSKDEKVNKKVIFFVVFIFLAVLLLVLSSNLAIKDSNASAGNTYYVALNGSDGNLGTETSPYKTFAKGVSMLQPGDTLYIRAGTYNEKLSMNKSGTSTSRIKVAGYPNEKVIIDLKSSNGNNVYVTGTYVDIENVEAMNSNDICINLSANFTTVKNSIAHECVSHGIYTDKEDVLIEGNTVYHATTENKSLSMSSGWGSGIKVRVGGKNTTIRNNTVYNNYGEGIAATRALGGTIVGNIAYDNYNVNIYIDNSRDYVIERNFAYCNPSSGFEHNGVAAAGFSIGEEYYDGWGAQLGNLVYRNNFVAYCGRGIIKFKADVPNGGLDNVKIVNNTFWGTTQTAISMEYDVYKTKNSLVANNIIQRATTGDQCWLENRTGVEMYNNFWVGNNVSTSSNCRGTNDKYGDVMLENTPIRGDKNTVKIKATSPAVNTGVNTTYDSDDIFAGLRLDGMLDIGAHEVGAVFNSTTNLVCTSFTYSDWSLCNNGTQIRTVTATFPGDCTGGTPILSQTCTMPAPAEVTCTSFTYSGWSTCSNGSQTRTVTSSSPAGCTGGTPTLTQSCIEPVITPPPSPTPTPTTQSIVYIFDDALKTKWYNASWGAQISLNETSPVYSGAKSISYKSNKSNSGFYIRSNPGIDTSGFTKLVFAVYGTSSIHKYKIHLRNNDSSELSDYKSLDFYGGQPIDGQWKVYEVPLSDLNAVNKMVYGFVIRNDLESKQSTIYIDAIGFK